MKSDKIELQDIARHMLVGKVVSTKMQDSIIVEVPRIHRHPIYKKALHRSQRFLAHCDTKKYAVGDMVQITETRPISRNKHYRVVSKILL